jgi:hypothetical protein
MASHSSSAPLTAIATVQARTTDTGAAPVLRLTRVTNAAPMVSIKTLAISTLMISRRSRWLRTPCPNRPSMTSGK